MTETFLYDVFLSHSSHDKPAVRELAQRLKADGLRVWLDEWIIQPGDMIGLKIEEGLQNARTLVLVMSANAFGSDWITLERHTVLFRDPTNRGRRFIPLLLAEAEIPDILKQFAYVDWRERSEAQYARLRAACRPAQQDKVPPETVHEANSGPVEILQGHTGTVYSVALTPDGQRAVSGSGDKTVRVWDLPPLTEQTPQTAGALRYTNAKVLLVGDSVVGKTGLALRLAENRFEATVSTDAAWATQLSLPHNASGKGMEREIWLWDFAGQADYRLIHQLYMDETALAAFVFNPQSENPFEGLGQWDRDLQRAARRPFRKLLVAGRCDRGGLMVSREAVEQFAQERGFDAYLETSARTGKGCEKLREAIIGHIAWETIPWTSSPRIFKLLKEAIVKLKDEGKALLRMGELKQQLEMRLPGEAFTLEELRAVVGLLAGPGVVWKLEFGDFVLLQPERINAYAAATIRKVRSHTDELGYILEEDVLDGKLDFQDMKRLPSDEESIVLRAMHQTFVDHGLCLREPTDKGVLLVFPSYFKRERPELLDYPAIFITCRFSGPLDEIYATLIVRLHHTPAFERDRLWRFAADFKTLAAKRVGLKMTKKAEGAAEIVVYFEAGIPDDTKVTFIRYVHDHLTAKGQEVVRERYYFCPDCGTPVENRTAVRQRLERGLQDIVCGNCEGRVPLWDLIEQKFASEEMQRRVLEMDRTAQAGIDNQSQKLNLISHAFAIAGEAGQIFRPILNSDLGIDGEIEFKDDRGEASGRRVYLQLNAGNSYLYKRQSDEKEVITIQAQHAEYWHAQAYPVMLVIRTSDGQIRWMDVSDYLRRKTLQPVNANDPSTMNLSGEQTKQLLQALISAFPTIASLRVMVRTELGENLDAIAGGTNLAEAVFNLVQWAEAQGRLEELVKKASHENPGNQALRRFIEVTQIVFEGEAFTASSVIRLRDRVLG